MGSKYDYLGDEDARLAEEADRAFQRAIAAQTQQAQQAEQSQQAQQAQPRGDADIEKALRGMVVARNERIERLLIEREVLTQRVLELQATLRATRQRPVLCLDQGASGVTNLLHGLLYDFLRQHDPDHNVRLLLTGPNEDERADERVIELTDQHTGTRFRVTVTPI